ncbi:hypothetical protein [Streptomyces buecherae]|uniref:hypothetical protein n=1 Tax=Streptomyces buecherae TaxID=2763006 RepID=UPI001C265E7A|nr:hypothetical protein [Streptomyces buecherae]
MPGPRLRDRRHGGVAAGRVRAGRAGHPATLTRHDAVTHDHVTADPPAGDP